MIGSIGIGDHVIELGSGLVIFASPRLAAIERERDAAVVRRHHAPRILGINPQPVIVSVRNFYFVKAASAVGGLVKINIEEVHRVGILRIGDHVHVVPRPLLKGAVVIDQFPGLTTIVGTVKPTFLGFD